MFANYTIYLYQIILYISYYVNVKNVLDNQVCTLYKKKLNAISSHICEQKHILTKQFYIQHFYSSMFRLHLFKIMCSVLNDNVEYLIEIFKLCQNLDILTRI